MTASAIVSAVFVRRIMSPQKAQDQVGKLCH
jgi:hypothetical protein